MKTTKILAALILVLSVITLNSCKKDKKESVSATITANIDGTATTFANAKAVKGTVSGITITTIQGTAANGAKLAIALQGTITAGKTFSALAGTSSDDEPIILYSTTANDYLNDDSSAATLSSVTISSVSSSSIQGTFKAHLVSTGASGADKVVTDGKFDVSF